MSTIRKYDFEYKLKATRKADTICNKHPRSTVRKDESLVCE